MMYNKEEAMRRLLKLRDRIAAREHKEKFKILQNKTIEAIVAAMPRSLEELRLVKGIGEKKVSKFGYEILNALGFNEGDLKYQAEEEGERRVYTVSAFLDRVNLLLEVENNVFVRGEVSNIQILPSGTYFSLKDKEDESVLNCYISPRLYRALGVEVESGMEVLACGTAAIYKPKGRLSFVINTLELTGEGSLKRSYELLKKKLESEGLFLRKRPLPEFISKIGIITSRTGAVIDDFRKNLAPLGMQLYLYDARVEGARAVSDVISGIRWFNAHMPDLDVLVIMRGGGSLEDLQAFDNENVARAIFASKIPTICSIGHHRDVTIAGLTGDVETSTPSFAAIIVNQSWRRLIEELPLRERELLFAYQGALQMLRAHADSSREILLRFLERLINRISAIREQLVAEFRRLFIKCGEIDSRSLELLRFAVLRLEGLIKDTSNSLLYFESQLKNNDPLRNLRLGYSILFSSEGNVVKSPEDISIGEEVTVRIYRGEIGAKVKSILKKENGPK